MHILKSNLGMYAETVVQRSCDYYRMNEIAFIEKRQLPIKIIKKINSNTIIGKLIDKSSVDFFGCFNTKHLEFEVKETSDKNFSLSMLKQHQFDYLKKLNNNKITCFLIVYFAKYDEFYLLDFFWVLKYIEKYNIKSIKYEDIKKHCKLLQIKFPGILNFLET
jgi:recombination protein U